MACYLHRSAHTIHKSKPACHFHTADLLLQYRGSALQSLREWFPALVVPGLMPLKHPGCRVRLKRSNFTTIPSQTKRHPTPTHVPPPSPPMTPLSKRPQDRVQRAIATRGCDLEDSSRSCCLFTEVRTDTVHSTYIFLLPITWIDRLRTASGPCIAPHTV